MIEKLKVFVIENKEVLIKKTIVVGGVVVGLIAAGLVINAMNGGTDDETFVPEIEEVSNFDQE